MKELPLLVCGYHVSIDYDKERVNYINPVSDDIANNINNYLINEGFLDKSFVKEMKSKYQPNK